LNASEEALWRAFAMVLNVLPRVLDGELQESAHISAPEYVALASLGDARPEGLRINELAGRVGLSPSRVSRLADSLVRRGEVHRDRSVEDGRGSRLRITEAGLARVEAAWPHQVASVRRHVLDHVAVEDHAALTRAFRSIMDRPAGE
jgi:DNA-binding MarR family transcriptional regulator